MAKKIIIVESPVKVKTIQKYLGKTFKVVATNGHIRDLPKKEFGVDIEDHFTPSYRIDPKKKPLISSIKAVVNRAEEVILATDDDREGEAIAWHIKEVLALPEAKYQRIVFRSITKKAIDQALANPRKLDLDLINAQQARRISDRIVGYKLSPILWRVIQGRLSAGRVQSVAVRLIVEREKEIQTFHPSPRFKLTAQFNLPNNKTLKAALPNYLASYEEAHAFLTDCQSAAFTIQKIDKTLVKRSPSPPFMTSTLQQVAGQELGFTTAQTMRIAQSLYEQGYITYIRTDSLHLSPEALANAKEVITTTYGANYHQTRVYPTKSTNAQEAHEAIRPTNFQQSNINSSPQEHRLYKLIRNRALASQMSDALIDKTALSITISTRDEELKAIGEMINFPGFFAAFSQEKHPIKSPLPQLDLNTPLTLFHLEARESFTKHPPRYTEPTLVKTLEQLGIGRPSTYSGIISTIQQRDYVDKRSTAGEPQNFRLITLQDGLVAESTFQATIGGAAQKLFPTSIGVAVNELLCEKFKQIMDYQFTADIEQKLDLIAQQKLTWETMLKDFYTIFQQQLHLFEKGQAEQANLRDKYALRPLGIDPATQKPIFARLSRKRGPLVQMGTFDDEVPPRFASLRKDQLLDQIDLKQALELLSLPREVGRFEDALITAHIGKFGPYLKHQDRFFSLKDFDPYTIAPAEAIQVIQEKRKAQTPLKTFPQDPAIQILVGRYGPYIKTPHQNVRIPPTKVPQNLTWEEVQTLLQQAKKKQKRR